MGDMISRFLSFDKLIGTSLIKVLYWVGLVGIAIFTIISIFGAFGSMRDSFFAGLGGVILAPIIGLISVALWRFMCEIYLLMFRISDDLRDIKNDRLGLEANTKNVDSEL
jgi:hypothetical protein